MASALAAGARGAAATGTATGAAGGWWRHALGLTAQAARAPSASSERVGMLFATGVLARAAAASAPHTLERLGERPPLTEADWQAEFTKYKASPEYQKVHRGMSLEEFKFIYWMEYAHR
ncbi:hypothetical protein GPECTOR_88g459 [Gonium pectorale]|uniref:Uncharacterized protein n=1 Tax=Gonium pectorale TaxID=33097 RepID=A0A150G0W2_GONPE|nr:hypothetical protein GPECTOR_88g459 [Gonium pectorale]|eukprot:KXZ43516.1 hypothetical protein GPECTOR_88g459 [Gonium pectorale]